MIALAALILAAAGGAQPAQSADRTAITAAAIARHGPHSQLDSVFVSGDFAVIRGTSGTAAFHDGLRRGGSAWHVTCALREAAPSSTTLARQCGFSQPASIQLAADDSANLAAEKGDFSRAAASEQKALQFASPESREVEAQRAQLLSTLNQQMNLGQISRPDAIQKWNEMRFSFYLP